MEEEDRQELRTNRSQQKMNTLKQCWEDLGKLNSEELKQKEERVFKNLQEIEEEDRQELRSSRPTKKQPIQNKMEIKPKNVTHKLISSKKNLRIVVISLLSILIISILAFTIIRADKRYDTFLGNWEIKPTDAYLDGSIIKNISIFKSDNLFLVYAKGDIEGDDWGPLLYVAKPNNGVLQIEPCKFFGLRKKEIMYNDYFTQDFKIYYSSEYDRLIVGNAFFIKGKVTVWNN